MKVPGSLLLMLTFAAVPAAAQTDTRPQRPTFRSGASLVALNVTVQDNTGSHYVSGLQSGDFAVYEDGVKQDVRFFESTAVPVDLIVLIDSSSSMSDKMDLVHEAATGFLKTLRDGDRGAVVTFADTVNVLQPLTGNVSSLEKAVASTRAHGSTALNNAIYIALKEFGAPAKQDGEVRRQAIVVLSDGEDNCSLISFDDVVAEARKTGVSIYTVSVQSRYAAQRVAMQGGRRYFSEADYGMKTLARETGAMAFFPAPTDLKAVYSSIAQELANQYSIGYVPVDTRADGRFRRVLVQVVTRPDLRPRTRQGYTVKGYSAASSNEQ